MLASGDDLHFPPAASAIAEGPYAGLVAVGGDLSAARMLLAYRSGIFPWTVSPVTWWSPDPRAIFEMDRFHVSRSLAAVLRKRHFEVSRNRAFREVMEACADPARQGSWITPEFIEAYHALHLAGHAHSIECWLEGRLVGGVYGVAVGGLFAGESMFHRADNASKVGLYHLIEHLRERGYILFDTQIVTPATSQLGAIEIPRAEYLRRLALATSLNVTFE